MQVTSYARSFVACIYHYKIFDIPQWLKQDTSSKLAYKRTSPSNEEIASIKTLVYIIVDFQMKTRDRKCAVIPYSVWGQNH